MDLTVGQVAAEFDVTVRTLHHYDQIGLLVPSRRTGAGYRLYTAADLQRLAVIVTLRRLGLPLEQVGQAVDGGDVVEHLRRRRAVVTAELADLARVVDLIDDALEDAMSNTPATEDDLVRIFADGYDEEVAAQAEQRWGETDAWAQSRQRTAHYTAADWEEVKAETEAINAAFAAAMDAGESADSPVAMAAAEQHRAGIERFYDCSPAMHRHLGDMYLADPRFMATYEAVRPGMAQYVRDALWANAQRAEAAASGDAPTASSSDADPAP